MSIEAPKASLKERVLEVWWNITSFTRSSSIRVEGTHISTRFRTRSQAERHEREVEKRLDYWTDKYFH